MRTTLTLDHDVADALRKHMKRTGHGLKITINDAIRLGLRVGGRSPRRQRFKVQSHAFGVRPGIDLDRINQLVDELDAEDAARKIIR